MAQLAPVVEPSLWDRAQSSSSSPPPPPTDAATATSVSVATSSPWCSRSNTDSVSSFSFSVSSSETTASSSLSSLLSETNSAVSTPNCMVDNSESCPRTRRTSSLPDITSSECTVLVNYHAMESGPEPISPRRSPSLTLIKSINSSTENLDQEDCTKLGELSSFGQIVTTPKMPKKRSKNPFLFSPRKRVTSRKSYLNDQSLNRFFALIQQLRLVGISNPSNYSATFAKMNRFLAQLCKELRDLEAICHLDGLSGSLSEYQPDRYLSNSHFANLIKSTLLVEPAVLSTLSVRFERDELWLLIEWLYPGCCIRQMFDLIEHVKRTLRTSAKFGSLVNPDFGNTTSTNSSGAPTSSSSSGRYSSSRPPTNSTDSNQTSFRARNRNVFDSIRELTVRHSKTPMLDSLHRVPANSLGQHCDSYQYHHQTDLMLLIFCYRAAICQYRSRPIEEPSSSNDSALGCVQWPSLQQQQQQQLDCFALGSSSYVRHLYQLAVQLTLLASVYADHQMRQKLVAQLLRIKPNNLEVESSIEQALELFNYESIALSQEIDMMATLDMFENEMELRTVMDPQPGPPQSAHGQRRTLPSGPGQTESASSPLSPSAASSLGSSHSPSTSLSSSTTSDYDINNNSTSTFNENDGLSSSATATVNNSESIPTHQLVPLYLQGKRELLEKIKAQGISLLAPINNRWSFKECGVCCDTLWLLVRSCCSFPVCLDCLHRYYTGRIEMGSLSIECIGPECKDLVYRSEVSARLSPETRALYSRLLLVQSSESARAKPCPQCNTILTLSPQQESTMKQATKRIFARRIVLGLSKSDASVNDSFTFKVQCDRCQFDWCFKCHSPWHQGLSCKQNMKGDALLKTWAKKSDYAGQINAQKCPRCKIYIQRTSGCDHMHCTRCLANFCYKCGDQLRNVKFFGDHYSKLSVLGCKYRYKPNSPFQRRLVRGTVFGSKLVLLPVLSTVCLCAGAVVLALGVAALPLFGGMRIYRQLKHRSSKFVHPSSLFGNGGGGGGDNGEQRRFPRMDTRPDLDQIESDELDQDQQTLNNADLDNLVGTLQMTPLQLARLFDVDRDQDEFDFAEMLADSVAMHSGTGGLLSYYEQDHSVDDGEQHNNSSNESIDNLDQSIGPSTVDHLAQAQIKTGVALPE